MRPLSPACGNVRTRKRTNFFAFVLKIFTIYGAYAIIFCVKKLILSAACAAALALTCYAGIGTEYAAAESSADTVYPDFVSTLDEGGFSAYAVGDGSFAFARDTRLYIYEGGVLSPSEQGSGYIYEGGVMDAPEGQTCAYEHSTAITGLGYIEGKVAFSDGTDTYIYADGEVAASSSALPPESDGIITNGSLAYSIRSDGMLSVTDMTDFAEGLPEGRYSSLKLAGGKVYALLDGGLCAIEGSEIDDISVVRFTFRYTDVSQEHTIAVGDSAALLKAGTAVCRATVPAGQYVTAIDLSRLDGQYFIVDEDASPSTRPAETDTEALVLCTTGNADIIAIGNETYITRSLGEKTEYGLSAPPFENAQLNYPAGMYSMPCMNEATQLLRLDPGEKVKVEGMISAVEGGALIADFCKVTYTADDGTSVTGYIAEDFLTVYNFTGEDGQFSDPTPPDDYSEDDVVLTVVLVIVIVVLVIACVAYLAYASGANRRQKRQEPEDEDTMNEEE